jgi:hypothetical protein
MNWTSVKALIFVYGFLRNLWLCETVGRSVNRRPYEVAPPCSSETYSNGWDPDLSAGLLRFAHFCAAA